jgi:hypothetical protein
MDQCASKADISELNMKVDALHNTVLRLIAQGTHTESFSSAAVEAAYIESRAESQGSGGSRLYKRTRAERAAAPVSALDDNEIFGTVLSYVGYGDYCYVAGVCRKWRGCYISFCHSNAPVADKYKLRTLRRAVITTAARLQLALDNGAKLTVLDVAGTRFSDSSLA